MNPYQTPPAISADDRVGRDGASGLLLLGWPIVFGLNTIIPGMLGWGLTREHGRLGALVALALFLAGGWMLCYRLPFYGRRLVAGSAFFAVTQFFPAIQFIAGICTFKVACQMDLAIEEGDGFDLRISSEFGGFVVTALVGAALLACAALTGWLFGLLGRDRRRPVEIAGDGNR